MDWFRSKVKELLNKDSYTIKVCDKVKIKDGVNAYYNGKKLPSWVKKSTLYARKKQVKDGIEVWLVSTNKTLPIYTGRVKVKDVVKI